MKKLFIKSIIACCALSLVTLPVSAETRFNDVSETHWAYNNIENAASKGLIHGYEDNTFKPNNTMSKLEFLSVIPYGVAPVDHTDDYVKRTEEDCDAYVAKFNPPEWAKTKIKGLFHRYILTEDDTEFYNFNEPITRDEITKILHRVEVSTEWLAKAEEMMGNAAGTFPQERIASVYFDYLQNEYINTKTDAEVDADYEKYSKYIYSNIDNGVHFNDTKREKAARAYVRNNCDMSNAQQWFTEYIRDQIVADSAVSSETKSATAAKIADWNTIASEYKAPVAYAYEVGLMSGYENGTFKPNNTVTRAEAATILLNAYNYFNN